MKKINRGTQHDSATVQRNKAQFKQFLNTLYKAGLNSEYQALSRYARHVATTPNDPVLLRHFKTAIQHARERYNEHVSLNAPQPAKKAAPPATGATAPAKKAITTRGILPAHMVDACIARHMSAGAIQTLETGFETFLEQLGSQLVDAATWRQTDAQRAYRATKKQQHLVKTTHPGRELLIAAGKEEGIFLRAKKAERDRIIKLSNKIEQQRLLEQEQIKRQRSATNDTALAMASGEVAKKKRRWRSRKRKKGSDALPEMPKEIPVVPKPTVARVRRPTKPDTQQVIDMPCFMHVCDAYYAKHGRHLMSQKTRARLHCGLV